MKKKSSAGIAFLILTIAFLILNAYDGATQGFIRPRIFGLYPTWIHDLTLGAERSRFWRLLPVEFRVLLYAFPGVVFAALPDASVR